MIAERLIVKKNQNACHQKMMQEGPGFNKLHYVFHPAAEMCWLVVAFVAPVLSRAFPVSIGCAARGLLVPPRVGGQDFANFYAFLLFSRKGNAAWLLIPLHTWLKLLPNA